MIVTRVSPVLVSFETVDELFGALKRGQIKQALVDGYVVSGNGLDFLERHRLDVEEILDSSATYGIVAGGDVRRLKKCFTLYRVKKLKHVFKQIQRQYTIKV